MMTPVSASKKKTSPKVTILRFLLLLILVSGVGVFLYTEGNAKNIRSKLMGDTTDKTVLVPHKALYNIALHSVKNTSKVINVEGQMLYSMERTCEGYLSNHHFNLLYEYEDTPGLMVTSDFTSSENFAGNKLEFFSSRNRESDLIEEYSGAASLDAKGTGIAQYIQPLERDFILPEGTVFPTQHTFNVINAAKKGQKFYTATVFDGSDETGPLLVNAFILDSGAPLAPVNASLSKTSKAVSSQLLDTKSWKVRLAFFPLESDLSEADYEMTVRLHENGVISDMFVEYTDFSVTQKLVAIEEITKAECRNNDR